VYSTDPQTQNRLRQLVGARLEQEPATVVGPAGAPGRG
jgi:hypothetical protein